MSKTPFIEFGSDDFTISQFDTEVIEGYQAPENSETGEKFPFCCNYHKGIYSIAQDWFGQFPNCCEIHKKLGEQEWFKKEIYSSVPYKIVNQLSFIH